MNAKLHFLFRSVLLIVFAGFVLSDTVCFGSATYTYDSLNRLTNVNYGNGSAISYTYDAAGNRLAYSGAVANDAVAPTISITSPTSNPSYTNGTSTISLSGTASDNVAVTTVVWSNDRGGIGVATGTNNWSIANIPLKYGINPLTVTAYDAAGNSTAANLTVTFAPTVGGTVTTTTTNTAFQDNFSGNVINSSVWSWWGNTVIQSNGTMEVMTTVTDQPGGLTNKQPFAISSTGLITITRRVLLHLDTPQSYNGGTHFFTGIFAINIPGVPQFSVQYDDYDYSDAYLKPTYGFFICRNAAGATSRSQTSDVSPGITALWDTWFNEKITYDPATGQLQYFTNDVLAITFNVGAVPAQSSPTMSFYFQAYGWWTTHYQWFQNLQVSQVSSNTVASVSAQWSQITGYHLANGIFHFALTAPTGSNYVIYASSDLKYWTPLETNSMPGGGLITFVDSDASSYPQRFYRALPLGVAVTLPPTPPTPELTEIGMSAGGAFQFNLNGPVGSNYVMQASSNLVNWINVSTNTIPSGGMSGFSFPINPSQPQMFYRALPAP